MGRRIAAGDGRTGVGLLVPVPPAHDVVDGPVDPVLPAVGQTGHGLVEAPGARAIRRRRPRWAGPRAGPGTVWPHGGPPGCRPDGGDLGSDRGSGHHRTGQRVPRPSDGAGPGEPPEQPVGRPGHGIHVDQHQGNPRDHGGQRRRQAGIAADRDHHPGVGPGPPARRPRTAATARPATAPMLLTRSAGRRLRTMPRPGSRVTGNPRPSRVARSWPRLDPTNSMVPRPWPASTRASAMASAGWRWPAVPPPATSAYRSSLTGGSTAAQAGRRAPSALGRRC